MTDDHLLPLPDPQRWTARAACKGADPAIFHPAHETNPGRGGRDWSTAAAYCAACPVRAECLADAVHHDNNYGYRGGLAPDELRRLGECRICGTVFERVKGAKLCSGPCRREASRRQNAAYMARQRAEADQYKCTCGLDFGADHDGYARHVRAFGDVVRGCAS